MFGFFKRKKIEVNTTQAIDAIENSVYAEVKPFGFRKYGRTLHRFVDEDVSQVINFQCGQAYRGEMHLMWVNVGIRVPECQLRNFSGDMSSKKYYHEYDCNIRSRLGEIKGKKVTTYDLRTNNAAIVADIICQINGYVLPTFEKLKSRELILQNRRDYPHFDTFNNHMILLEEAMIYGRMGNVEKAKSCFEQYKDLSEKGQSTQKDPVTIKRHLEYLDGLAVDLNLK